MSMQFPPSSPLRDEMVKKDPFFVRGRDTSKDSSRDTVTFEYPTPHPSSTTGRSSSPHRGDDEYRIEPKKVSFDVNKPVMNVCIGSDETNYSIDGVKITKVPLCQSSFVIGRSSQQSDIVVRTKDRAMSRRHLLVSHDDTSISIECLGSNGYGITIPLSCDVNKVSDFEYELVECSKAAVKQLKNSKLSNTIKLTENYTEFLVQKGEVITLPKLENLVIEIKKNVLVINPIVESEETDDEVPIKEHQKKEHKTKENKTQKRNQTPIKVTTASSPLTPSKRGFKITSEESTPIKYLKSTSSRLPLGDISNLVGVRGKSEEPNPLPISSKLGSSLGHSRSKSTSNIEVEEQKVPEEPEEPEEPEKEADMSTVNVPEISNILVNHLAFSRLASTKLTMLKGVSGNINELSSSQLKDVLKDIKSIGVIYRDGKDAAGKPLDPEYYYIPEEDDDENRRNLVGSIKGHGGIRRCRTTHKQYYWKKPAPIKNKSKK